MACCKKLREKKKKSFIAETTKKMGVNQRRATKSGVQRPNYRKKKVPSGENLLRHETEQGKKIAWQN